MHKILVLVLVLFYFTISGQRVTIYNFENTLNKDSSFEIVKYNSWKFIKIFHGETVLTIEDLKKEAFNPIIQKIGKINVWNQKSDSLKSNLENNYFVELYSTMDEIYYSKNNKEKWAAYDQNFIKIFESKYKDLFVFNDKMKTAIVRIENKFGLINKNQKTILDFEFDYMSPFYNHMIRAIKDDVHYLIKLDGTIISQGINLDLIPIKGSSLYLEIKNDNKLGIIDIYGNLCVEPSKYLEYVNKTTEDLNSIIFMEDGQFGVLFDKNVCLPINISGYTDFIDLVLIKNKPHAIIKNRNRYLLYDFSTCKTIINNIEAFKHPFYIKTKGKWYNFSNVSLDEVNKYDFEPITIMLNNKKYHKVFQNGKYGIVDQTEKFVLNPDFDEIKLIGNDKIYVIYKGLFRILKSNFEYFTNDEFDFIFDSYSDVENNIKVVKNGEILLIDKFGRYQNLTEDSEIKTQDFGNKKGKFRKLISNIFEGLVDTLGNEILAPNYNLVYPLEYKSDSNYLFYIRRNNLRGFLNKDTLMYPLNIRAYNYFGQNCVKITELNNSTYLFNFDMNKKSESFESIEHFPFKLLLVYKQGKYNLINYNFESIFSKDYDFIELKDYFGKQVIALYKENKIGLYQSDKTPISEYMYNDFKPLSGLSYRYYKVFFNNKVGLINKHGELVLPIKYDNIIYSSKEENIFAFEEGIIYKFSIDCNSIKF